MTAGFFITNVFFCCIRHTGMIYCLSFGKHCRQNKCKVRFGHEYQRKTHSDVITGGYYLRHQRRRIQNRALGVDPFQTLMAGLDKLIPISFGTLYVIVNLLLLIFSVLVDRHNIGIATFINLFLLGYITDFTFNTLQKLIIAPSLLVRSICLVVGIVVICFGSALYMTADLGVSTYDAVAIVMSRKWKVAKFQYCRIFTDVICVVLGVALFLLAGGTWGTVPTIAGIGTIITAFFMGPVIEFFNVTVARPLLNGRKG